MLTTEQILLIVQLVDPEPFNGCGPAIKSGTIWNILKKRSTRDREDLLLREKIEVYHHTNGRIDHLSDHGSLDSKKTSEIMSILSSPSMLEEYRRKLHRSRSEAYQARLKVPERQLPQTTNDQYQAKLKQRLQEFASKKGALDKRFPWQSKPSDHRPQGTEACFYCDGLGRVQNRTCSICRGYGFQR